MSRADVIGRTRAQPVLGELDQDPADAADHQRRVGCRGLRGNVDVYQGPTRLAHGRTDSKGNKVFTTTSAAGRATF